MPRSLPRVTAALAILLLITSVACGGGEKEAAPKKTTSTTAETTTTMAAPTNLAPLTGLPADPALLARPLLVVKIDNAPKARPPVGINDAEAVYSEKVEDGVTRLFTMFHTTDADSIGPVRSARTTDIILSRPLNRPLFAYSGAAGGTVEQIRRSPMVDLSPNTFPSAFRRERSRPAPHNLFSATKTLRRPEPQSGPPPALFAFRAEGAPVSGAGAADAKGVHVEYIGKNVKTIVDYAWDAASGGWQRTQDGTPYSDSNGRQISPRNVIVQLVNYRDTGGRDTTGSPVDEAELVGEGEVWVLTGGKVIKGRWKRTADEVTQYLDSAGKPILLTPGQTWVELAVAGNPNRLS